MKINQSDNHQLTVHLTIESNTYFTKMHQTEIQSLGCV